MSKNRLVRRSVEINECFQLSVKWSSVEHLSSEISWKEVEKELIFKMEQEQSVEEVI